MSNESKTVDSILEPGGNRSLVDDILRNYLKRYEDAMRALNDACYMLSHPLTLFSYQESRRIVEGLTTLLHLISSTGERRVVGRTEPLLVRKPHLLQRILHHHLASAKISTEQSDRWKDLFRELSWMDWSLLDPFSSKEQRAQAMSDGWLRIRQHLIGLLDGFGQAIIDSALVPMPKRIELPKPSPRAEQRCLEWDDESQSWRLTQAGKVIRIVSIEEQEMIEAMESAMREEFRKAMMAKAAKKEK